MPVIQILQFVYIILTLRLPFSYVDVRQNLLDYSDLDRQRTERLISRLIAKIKLEQYYYQIQQLNKSNNSVTVTVWNMDNIQLFPDWLRLGDQEECV